MRTLSFPQKLQVNAIIVPLIKAMTFHFQIFPVYYLQNILSFHVTKSAHRQFRLLLWSLLSSFIYHPYLLSACSYLSTQRLALPTNESQNTLVIAHTSSTAAIQFINVNNIISSTSLFKTSSLLSISAWI